MAEPATFQGNAFGRPEGIVGVGLTVPFGSSRRTEPPRVELRGARDVVNIDGSRQSSITPDQMEARIGVALAPGHRLLVNSRPIEPSRRNGISTVGWIAIGVGAAVIVGGVLFADALNDASE